MRKWFVLSLGTVLSKRGVTQSFGSDNAVIITRGILEELQMYYGNDKYDERSKIAYELSKYVCEFGFKKLSEGVVQENGSILKVCADKDLPTYRSKVEELKMKTLEKQLIKVCLDLKTKIPKGEKVILVSRNPYVRMCAEDLGIEAQTFKDELSPEIPEQYAGRASVKVTTENLTKFFKTGELPAKVIKDLNPDIEFFENMFLVMKSDGNKSALGRIRGDKVVNLIHERKFPYGIIPKNVGQKFMLEALMMDEREAPLVIIKGPAGTGKTFLALAAGLQHVDEGKFPKKILISRSPTETGEKIGFLPGGESDKIGPYLRGAIDNLDNIYHPNERKADDMKVNKDDKGKGEKGKSKDNPRGEEIEAEAGSYFFKKGLIKAEAIGYIRGRTICETYIIIDEAQNLTPMEIKTIITRVGFGTKLVVMGDPAQIDRPGLNERNNGLSYASERLKILNGNSWQITMEDDESVRSELAKEAAKLL